MKIVWSHAARKALLKLDNQTQIRIKAKLAALKDRSAPRPDLRKMASLENHFRLRVGDYRIILTLAHEPENECFIIAVKRRTTTTYLHEESVLYGCSND
ncbi:type II toxin-antitoxin system RelE/ParE family toxin [Leclercia pneumoniae]|jgi:mRNA interferase RelE/StbE|uniref:type II toxin-antitoxin system RelE family toxin n=1 Tax=Leclercia pneumoniae TaxID=2815358 RepID=UPI002DB83835|nr:type II toxin-antitoxin system RelE/ParE family toxin [Leclercia pneumoniae]MEB7500551.1 type II toxin-antitoxin system RelE/ParE family toxin [Leclercia pneumoniae]